MPGLATQTYLGLSTQQYQNLQNDPYILEDTKNISYTQGLNYSAVKRINTTKTFSIILTSSLLANGVVEVILTFLQTTNFSFKLSYGIVRLINESVSYSKGAFVIAKTVSYSISELFTLVKAITKNKVFNVTLNYVKKFNLNIKFLFSTSISSLVGKSIVKTFKNSKNYFKGFVRIRTESTKKVWEVKTDKTWEVDNHDV